MKKSLLYTVFSFLIVLGILHYVGNTFYLYWDLRWYHSLAHFIGGASIGFLFLWIWYVSGLFGKEIPNKKQVFIACLLSGMIAGIGWELFEFANGIVHPIGNYALDTFNDLLADFCGAVFAGIIGSNKKFYE